MELDRVEGVHRTRQAWPTPPAVDPRVVDEHVPVLLALDEPSEDDDEVPDREGRKVEARFGKRSHLAPGRSVPRRTRTPGLRSPPGSNRRSRRSCARPPPPPPRAPEPAAARASSSGFPARRSAGRSRAAGRSPPPSRPRRTPPARPAPQPRSCAGRTSPARAPGALRRLRRSAAAAAAGRCHRHEDEAEAEERREPGQICSARACWSLRRSARRSRCRRGSGTGTAAISAFVYSSRGES